MTIDVSMLDKLRLLPPEKQQEVADLVDDLFHQAATSGERLRLRGLCADLQVELTAQDIDEARLEMWGGFPREDL